MTTLHGGFSAPIPSSTLAQPVKALLVEDDPDSLHGLARVLELKGFEVALAEDAEAARRRAADDIDLVASDLRLGVESGLDLLRWWKRQYPGTPFVLMTGYADVATAVQAMKLGAADYLTKPVHPDDLLQVFAQCLGARRAKPEGEATSGAREAGMSFDGIVGASRAMHEVFARVHRAARSDSTILILGESGTGKELLAQAIHHSSPRSDGPFVAVNMAAVPETLVESELFGHVRGAFTGATTSRVGRFQVARGGTIFIDEIGDFALESQAKLLRVLETRTITPVGSNTELEVDARVVAATSRNLEQMVAAGGFRDDLYYRLSVVTIALPPLRARPDDIPLLVRHFLAQLSCPRRAQSADVAPELMRFLSEFDWPGNVRQLRNCLESMVVMSDSPLLTLDDLPAHLRSGAGEAVAGFQIPPHLTLAQLEKLAYRQALERHAGNRTHAARALGVSVRTLQRRLQAWGGSVGDSAPASAAAGNGRRGV